MSSGAGYREVGNLGDTAIREDKLKGDLTREDRLAIKLKRRQACQQYFAGPWRRRRATKTSGSDRKDGPEDHAYQAVNIRFRQVDQSENNSEEVLMARLPHLDEQDLPEADRHLLARPIGVHRVTANLPEVLRGLVGIGDWVRFDSRMDARLRELAIVQVGVLASSVYEYAHHVKIALDFGVTPQDIDDLRRLAAGEATSFGETELTVLRAARELTLDVQLSEATWMGLEAAVGTEAASELVATIAYYGMVVRLLAAFDVELEPEYETYLQQYPMPEPREAIA